MKKLFICIVTIFMYAAIMVEAGLTGYICSKIINRIDSNDN